jgi:hypothetical protein
MTASRLLSRPALALAATTLALAAVIVFGRDGSSSAGIEGVTWRQMPAGHRPASTLRLEARQFNGDDGCNTFGGSYTLSDGVLITERGGTSLVACLDGDGRQIAGVSLTPDSEYRVEVSGIPPYRVLGLQTPDGTWSRWLETPDPPASD